MGKKSLQSVLFMCEWNEGRSAHLEMSVRLKLKRHGSKIEVMSAGFSQADRVSPLRKAFLLGLGVSLSEIDAHHSTIFHRDLAKADLILVAELPMKKRLLKEWPQLEGRVMTVRGFIKKMAPLQEDITEEEARMEDAGGKDTDTKLALYEEHERLAVEVAKRLIEIETGKSPFS